MAIPTLQDLTKDELIGLFQRHYLIPPTSELAWIIYQRKVSQAMAEMEEASADMNRLTNLDGLKARRDWLAAMKRWEKASKKHEASEAEYNRMQNEIDQAEQEFAARRLSI